MFAKSDLITNDTLTAKDMVENFSQSASIDALTVAKNAQHDVMVGCVFRTRLPGLAGFPGSPGLLGLGLGSGELRCLVIRAVAGVVLVAIAVNSHASIPHRVVDLRSPRLVLGELSCGERSELLLVVSLEPMPLHDKSALLTNDFLAAEDTIEDLSPGSVFEGDMLVKKVQHDLFVGGMGDTFVLAFRGGRE